MHGEQDYSGATELIRTEEDEKVSIALGTNKKPDKEVILNRVEFGMTYLTFSFVIHILFCCRTCTPVVLISRNYYDTFCKFVLVMK